MQHFQITISRTETLLKSSLKSDGGKEDAGSGPTDHWPTVTNAEACKLQHCSREMAACLLDPTCLASLTCPTGCTGEGFVAGLCNFECGEEGTRSPTYLAMMLCWGTHRCQESRPQPAGPCAAHTEWEGLEELTSLDLLEGSWRVVRAWNCRSGISFASCHHWRLSPTSNNISISLAGPSGPLYKQVLQRVSLPYPGVLRADYQQDNGAVSSPA